MVRVAGGDRIAQTGEVARALGKTPQQASHARQTLLKNGIVIAVGREQLVFNTPYLREYIEKEPGVDTNAKLTRLWRF